MSDTNGISPPPKGGWIIQKFGGTSIGKFATQIVDDIIRSYQQDNRVAIVCSARSSESKELGTTNRLLKAAAESLNLGSQQYFVIVDAIREDHLSAAGEHINSTKILETLKKDISEECSRLTTLLSAAQTLDEISPKTRDTVIGTGEKLSCMFMTALLIDRGIDAEYVNLDGIVPNAPHTKQVLDHHFYAGLSRAMVGRISLCEQRVPVVTGYFGNVPGSLLTSVGRGYTDLCAALIAVGLDAEELQIWKEVDGIFTADPRKVITAQLIPVVTPEEAAELTYYGSEVIHPFTMEQAINAAIPIRIKNVKNPQGGGTMIFPDDKDRRGHETPTRPPRHFRIKSNDSILQHYSKRPTAVTTKSGVVVLNVHSNRKSLSHGFLASIFSILDKWRLCVDLISTSEVHVSMALNPEGRDHDLREAVVELGVLGHVEVKHNLTILSLVGKHMKRMIGIAGRMFTVLADARVNIEMISQGASEINISCVIKADDAIRAMNVLHTRLFTHHIET